MPPFYPKRLPPLGPPKASSRQRVLAQWRRVDLEPLEKAAAARAKSVNAIMPRVLSELGIDRRRIEAEVVRVWNNLLDPNIVGAGTTSAQVSWSSVVAASYTLQYKTNLNDAVWLNLTNLTASGTNTTIVDNTSPVPNQRFYRVVSP